MSIRRLQAIVCASFLCAQIGGAQSVQGIVVARGENPVAGVVVLLVDSTSVIAARALSNARGGFRLLAPRAGTYRIRTLRIGFSPATSAPLALATGASREERIALTELSYSLDTTRVAARSVCRQTSPESLAMVFALWEQVRTALHAAELTASGGNTNVTTLRYARLMSRDMSRVLAQANEFRTDSLSAPWQSMSPDTLHERGYVRTGADDSVTYAAPGVDALVSDAFLDDHCFSFAEGTDDEIRIAFEPARDRSKLPEISGTVSVNRATTELRRIEYRYVNLPPIQMTQAGGDVAFVRLRDGGWVIPHWNVHMPVLGMFSGVRRELRVARVKVEGGELVAALRGGDTLWAHPPLVLSGRVLDSVSGAPVAGARVSVGGSRLQGETARDGSFRIVGLLPGRYGLEVRGPGRKYAGMAMAIPVMFTDSATPVDLRIPTATQVAGAVCQLEWLVTAVSGGAILTGRVDASFLSAPRGAVTVVAEWEDVHTYYEPASGRLVSESEHKAFETLADDAGEFRICFIPTNVRITVHAVAGDIRALEAIVRIPPELHFARVDLTLDSNLEPVTSLATTVRGDSATGPIAGVEVALPELDLFGVTDDRGLVRLSEVALGVHRLTVRREGFVSLDTMITLGKGRATNLPLGLRKLAPDAIRMAPAPFDESGESPAPAFGSTRGASGSRAASRTPLPPPLRARETASRECSPLSALPEAPHARAAAACAR